MKPKAIDGPRPKALMMRSTGTQQMQSFKGVLAPYEVRSEPQDQAAWNLLTVPHNLICSPTQPTTRLVFGTVLAMQLTTALNMCTGNLKWFAH